MSRELTKMNLIAIVQQLPKDDIEVVEVYIKMIEQENKHLQQRIDKTIEWINNHIDTFEERNITIYDWNSLSNPKTLLEILGGKEC